MNKLSRSFRQGFFILLLLRLIHSQVFPDEAEIDDPTAEDNSVDTEQEDDPICLLALHAQGCNPNPNDCGNFNGHQLSCVTLGTEQMTFLQCVCPQDVNCNQALSEGKVGQYQNCTENTDNCEGSGQLLKEEDNSCEQELFCAPKKSGEYAQCHTCESCKRAKEFDCSRKCEDEATKGENAAGTNPKGPTIKEDGEKESRSEATTKFTNLLLASSACLGAIVYFH